MTKIKRKSTYARPGRHGHPMLIAKRKYEDEYIKYHTGEISEPPKIPPQLTVEQAAESRKKVEFFYSKKNNKPIREMKKMLD